MIHLSMTILPIFVLFELFLLVRISLNTSLFCWRDCILLGSVLWGIIIVVSTEILSLFSLIAFRSILFFWAVVSFVLILMIVVKMKQKKDGCLKKLEVNEKIQGFSDKVFLFCITLIFFVVGVLSVASPPNNYDAMVYHMPRVVHWVQNNSVAHYPTHIIRQISFPPWAEYSILHFQILSSGDYFAGIVQWLALIGSVIGVSLITKHFGGNRKSQILSAVFVATLPTAILQGSSTQNDLSVAFWIICFVCFFLRSIRKNNMIYFIGMGRALGLSLLTKFTAYIFILPFLVWFFYNKLRFAQKGILKKICIVCLIALSVNAVFYARNIQLQGAPIKDTQNLLKELTPVFFVSNIARNIGS